MTPIVTSPATPPAILVSVPTTEEAASSVLSRCDGEIFFSVIVVDRGWLLDAHNTMGDSAREMARAIVHSDD
jgi:hypothetical protein